MCDSTQVISLHVFTPHPPAPTFRIPSQSPLALVTAGSLESLLKASSSSHSKPGRKRCVSEWKSKICGLEDRYQRVLVACVPSRCKSEAGDSTLLAAFRASDTPPGLLLEASAAEEEAEAGLMPPRAGKSSALGALWDCPPTLAAVALLDLPLAGALAARGFRKGRAWRPEGVAWRAVATAAPGRGGKASWPLGEPANPAYKFATQDYRWRCPYKAVAGSVYSIRQGWRGMRDHRGFWGGGGQRVQGGEGESLLPSSGQGYIEHSSGKPAAPTRAKPVASIHGIATNK